MRLSLFLLAAALAAGPALAAGTKVSSSAALARQAEAL